MDKTQLIERLQMLSKIIDSVMTDVCESDLYNDGEGALWDLENGSYLFDNEITTAIKALQKL